MFEQFLTKTGRLSQLQPQEIKNQYWINRFNSVHKGIFDYSKVVYSGNNKKVIIICEIHGEFTQTPQNHYNSAQGCPKCYLEAKPKSLQQFVEEQQVIHSNKYDYQKAQYKTAEIPICIICPIHQEFYQSPHGHLRGNGCPQCSKFNPTHIYIAKNLHSGLIKIGVSNNVPRRLKEVGPKMELVYTLQVVQALKLENKLHRYFDQYREYDPNVKSGNSEFFRVTEEQIQEMLWLIDSWQP